MIVIFEQPDKIAEILQATKPAAQQKKPEKKPAPSQKPTQQTQQTQQPGAAKTAPKETTAKDPKLQKKGFFSDRALSLGLGNLGNSIGNIGNNIASMSKFLSFLTFFPSFLTNPNSLDSEAAQSLVSSAMSRMSFLTQQTKSPTQPESVLSHSLSVGFLF